MVVAHFWERATALKIRTGFEIETLDNKPFDFLLDRTAVKFPFAYDDAERFALAPYPNVSRLTSPSKRCATGSKSTCPTLRRKPCPSYPR